MRSCLLQWLAISSVLVAFIVTVVDAQSATCLLQGTSNAPTVSGLVIFTRVNSSYTQVSINITGAPPGWHGIHVHDWGDMVTSTDGISAGGHFIGAGQANHACPPNLNRHSGDLGNIEIDQNGAGIANFVLDLLPLAGVKSILGHAVVLHEKEDDCTTQSPPGNAGSRIAWCVIGAADDLAFADSVSTTLPQTAVCALKGAPGFPEITGQVFISTQESGFMEVTAWIEGLKDLNKHGFHIHQYGDMSLPERLGGHYNPTSAKHALPGGSQGRHLGDLGNIQYYGVENPRRVWYYEKLGLKADNPMSLLLGRSIVLHEHADDGCTQPSGDSGSRWAYCVIGTIGADNFNPPVVPLSAGVKPQVGVECEDITIPRGPTAESGGWFWYLLIPTGVIAAVLLVFFGVRWFRRRRLVTTVV